MSILASDLTACLSVSVTNDPATNGGRPADENMPLSAKNNAFPDLNSATRTSGGTRRRKVFLCNRNAQNLPGEAVMVVMDGATEYADWAYFVPADFDGHESDLTGNEPVYGVAVLKEDAAAGATSIWVTMESGTLGAMLAEGRELLISSRIAFENTVSTVGTEELHGIVGFGFNGATNEHASISLDSPLENAYAAGARVSVVYRPPDLAPALSGWTESGAGSYDAAGNPVALTNRGAVRQRWTIRYESATSFTISGDTLGLLGTFRTTADAAPVNPSAVAGGDPYFTLPAAGHGSGHAAGDVIEFWTSPAACPLWVVHVIPPGVDAYGLTEAPIAWQVESPE